MIKTFTQVTEHHLDTREEKISFIKQQLNSLPDNAIEEIYTKVENSWLNATASFFDNKQSEETEKINEREVFESSRDILLSMNSTLKSIEKLIRGDRLG